MHQGSHGPAPAGNLFPFCSQGHVSCVRTLSLECPRAGRVDSDGEEKPPGHAAMLRGSPSAVSKPVFVSKTGDFLKLGNTSLTQCDPPNCLASVGTLCRLSLRLWIFPARDGLPCCPGLHGPQGSDRALFLCSDLGWGGVGKVWGAQRGY